MTQQTAYDRARKRAKAKLGFYNHLIVYGVVIGFLFLINLFSSPDYWWVIWPALGWGIGIALHGVTVFFRTEESETLERMTEHELELERRRHREG